MVECGETYHDNDGLSVDSAGALARGSRARGREFEACATAGAAPGGSAGVEERLRGGGGVDFGAGGRADPELDIQSDISFLNDVNW